MIALVVAGLAAAVLGFLTSFLVIRGADLTRLMVTLGIALLLEALAERFSNVTGGTDGLQGIEMQPIFGLFEFDMFGRTGLFYSLAVLFLLFLLARRIVHSPFGLSLRAIRNNPLRASAIGIPVNRRLIAIYTIAAFYAGIAGALFTQTTALASLDVFSFERSADLMLVLVIGGTGYLYGGLIGAVVFRMLQEVVFVDHAAILAVLDRPRAGRDRAGRPPAAASLGVVGAQSGHCADQRPQSRGRHSRKRRAMTFALETRALAKQFGGLKVTRDLSLRDRAGRAPRRDRPERRRQDHRHQSVDRRAEAQCRAHPAGGPRHHRFAGAPARAARPVAHLPDQSALCRFDAARDHRPRGVGAARPRRRLVAADGHARRRQREIAENLSRFHLLDVMNEPTATLPYGKQRLLEIAVAIAAKPRVLLLDEPAAGVPEGERHDILAAVAALPRDVTVLLIEHDMDLVFSFADRISVLVNGALLVEGDACRGRARSEGQGGLSRRGRRWLIFSPSKACAPAMAKPWCCPACRCGWRKGRCWRCWGATAPARPR